MSAPALRLGAGLVAGLAAMLLSGTAVAREMRWGRCVLTIPDTWTATGDRGQNPDGRVTVQMREVSSGRVFVNFQRVFGVHTLPDRTRELRVMYARAGNMTRYYAVAPPRSHTACIAQVTSSRASGNEEAERVARSLRRP